MSKGIERILNRKASIGDVFFVFIFLLIIVFLATLVSKTMTETSIVLNVFLTNQGYFTYPMTVANIWYPIIDYNSIKLGSGSGKLIFSIIELIFGQHWYMDMVNTQYIAVNMGNILKTMMGI